jgi:hypothetical protein
MVQRGRQASLAFEALKIGLSSGEFGRKNFDYYGAA